MSATLTREPPSLDGVFGELVLTDTLGDHHYFKTAEDDWRDNQPKISCIPDGHYICRRVVSPKFGDVFEVAHVPGRGNILIHAGNTEEDVEGCVLLGEAFGTLPRADEDLPGHPVRVKRAVVQSKVAFKRFMGLLAGVQSFPLEIRWADKGAV